MGSKTAKRPRVDVNLDELYSIIDTACQQAVTQTDAEKVRLALHSMAEHIRREWRSSEKKDTPCA